VISAAPVIHEVFTALPCPDDAMTTQALEGCAEQRILASDGAINVRVGKIYVLLPTAADRRTFALGETAWLAYRKRSCQAQSAKYAGGSLQPVAYAQCLAARNTSHLLELGTMLRLFQQH
jgi:uncharacterized protein YecT (DUF1311 family)